VSNRPFQGARSADDPKHQLSDRSDQILDAIEELHEMESAKREVPISTPTFHRLAEQITAKSRDVFRIARDQEAVGEEAPTGDETIQDVAREPAR
jgi:hypothetical protein